MAQTSGTYNFQSLKVDEIITIAFLNIGIGTETITANQLKVARTSINLLLLEWITKPPNLWTLKFSYLGLTPYQGQYFLPAYVSKIIQASLRTSTRQLNGTPTATGPNPEYAFDGDPDTHCNAGAGGSITYDYGAGITQFITFVGIQSNTLSDYTLDIRYSADGIVWKNLISLDKQTFPEGVIKWFDLPVPTYARYYRIIEIDGATLDIQELYFNNQTTDVSIANISRSEYFDYPVKYQISRPCLYYFDRQLSPTLNLLPIPSDQYNCLQYSYIQKMQDVGDIGNCYTNALDIPSHFYPAMVAGLSFKLAGFYNEAKAADLKLAYDALFVESSSDDTERTTFTIGVDPGGNNGGYY